MPNDTPSKLSVNPLKGVSRLGRWLMSGLSGANPFTSGAPSPKARPGESPGIESIAGLDEPPDPEAVRVYWCDYTADRIEWHQGTVDEFHASKRPEWSTARWVNVDGLHPYAVNQLRKKYKFHTLTAEDILRTSQRPKMELYENHLFTVVRMMRLEGEVLKQEQVSMLLYERTVITFQEIPGDVWGPIRERLKRAGGRLRSLDTSYLFYALLDAVVDHFYPILETYGLRLEQLEEVVLDDPGPSVQRDIHGVKRELSVLRRVMWPLREVANELQRSETTLIDAEVRTFLRDVYDHALQIMEIVEMHREQAASLNDLYMSAVGNRMNEIMKVLTIMASFFIPITFVAGVYGMNFDYIPELSWRYSYAVFWGACISISGGLAFYFWRRGWIGRK
ncbi:magnesium/cobalt transporter CorA [Actomonas aquatica]|uniref:Magnesium transport protein CorA n=1 Tax=Actomonas aquatica TaxID=2866162 RepID=A0ABZ1CAV7_9BACT|nr:magnesium/cobalt transporter CorA [Opitutus sp. WL0086]WRQ88811.1 magnesium/cobalt transporter CorA [Opitutus sp. WL0086]